MLISVLLGTVIPTVNMILPWRTSEIAALLGLGLVLALPIVRELFLGRIDVFEPLYLISFAALTSFGLAPIVMLMIPHAFSETGINYRPQLPLAVALAALGHVGFVAGYYVARTYGHRFKIGLPAMLSEPRLHTVLYRTAWIGLGLTLALFSAWLWNSGLSFRDLNTLSNDSYYRGFLQGSSNIYLYLLRVSFPALILLIFATGDGRWERPSTIVLWVALLALFLVSGNRGVVLRLCMSTAVLLYLLRDRRPRLVTVIVAMSLFAILAGSLLLMRSRNYEGTITVSRVTEVLTREFTSIGAASGTMVLTHVFPGRSDFVGLHLFEDLLLAPIPRAIWPDKPIIRDALSIAEQYVPLAHAPAYFGPYYAGFGIAGVVASMFVLGVLSSAIFEFWRVNRHSAVASVLLALWLGLTWEVYHRGGITWFVVNVVYGIGPLLICSVLALFFGVSGRASVREPRSNRVK